MGVCEVNCTGIGRPVSADAFRGLGPFPSRSMVYYLPQTEPIPNRVDLELRHGDAFIKFRDCLVDQSTSTRNSKAGFYETIILQDRRWQWEYRLISGRYNVRTPDGSIDPATQRTPQQLATLLFQAMGENEFDVAAIPNDGYPEIDWQYSKAAIELYLLAKDRGCDISLNTDNTVGLVRLGTGDPAGPSDDTQWASQTIDPPQPPDELIGRCDPTVFESIFKLEAIGLDVDYKYKSLANLSYKPPDGFAVETDIEHFQWLEENPIAQACARKSLYRTYQIVSFANGTLEITGYDGEITSIGQCLPIGQSTLDVYTDESGRLVAAPAEVFGQFVITADPPLDDNSGPGTTYDGEFRIDSKTGIVTFSRRVFKYSPSFEILPATLYLRVTFRLENANGQVVRDVVTHNLSSGGGQNQFRVDIPELNRRHKVTWTRTTEPPTPDGSTSNAASVDEQARAILLGVASRFTFSNGSKFVYRSIQNLTTNGVIRQIHWRVNTEKESQTIASNNFETIPYLAASPKQRQRATYKGLDLRRIQRAVNKSERDGGL